MSIAPTDAIPECAVTTNNVHLKFTDRTKTVPVPAGTTILEAANAAGVRLVSQCTIGTCGTCVGRVACGDVVMPEGRVYSLRQDEMVAGHRLLCQSHAFSESEVELDYPAAMLDEYPVVVTTAKVGAVTWLGETVVELQLKLPKSVRFAFRAGQYVRMRVPGTDEWRSYSMASGERDRKKLIFTIRVLPSGAMSEYLRSGAAVGDQIEIEGPIGGFGLADDAGPTLMIAGGTGLAPMLSMLETLQTARGEHPVRLVFGCTREADLFHLDELDARRGFMRNLDVRVVVDVPVSVPGVLVGNPVSVLTAEDVAHPLTSAYLCGPPAMLQAAEARLLELGMPAERIHAEQFLPS
ncbi:2Fe-2S iron-sulfur cluster binding domain-containing protein [Rhodococcus hoagii]|nr:2Fe-2S iron-sulfur cluster binding domain-containing protein [Prescottella equi]MBM4635053.1 2Fe-2S iron-sulfur cluster binding domain-containing protein [Prescottella equi]MBM4693830.1 2Fe-2S iron-sulfur cluster binding domain-containing protein [Prescottella equi]NKR31533.1 2Fe-2S iron-sulfur cluster binding domain-containing protein [Prescottella equi]NKR93557.1 2Fe-2S iron-sulfur cluster binding domain-containing protein [Prescottella equi]